MTEKKTENSLTLEQVIRALKDESYREGLGPDKLKQLPCDSAGFIRLLDAQFNIEAEAAVASLSFFTGTCGRVCQIITPEFSCDFVPSCW